MGFDFIVIAPLLPSHCGFSFVFGCGVSFLVSSSVFLSMIVQQLVVIAVLSQVGERAHPSTPPSSLFDDTFFLNFILFIFLYSRFLLVIHFIHISVYMSIPISQFNPLATFPPWCPYVCSLHLCLNFCPAN